MTAAINLMVRSLSRGGSIVGKFILLILVLRNHGTAPFAVFAIVQGWAVFASKVLGFGAIYWLNFRLARNASRKSTYLLAHRNLCLIGYALLALLMLSLRPYASFVGSFTFLFVLVAEHAATESNLLAYYAQRHRAADLAMLARNLWPIAAVVVLWFWPNTSMQFVYWVWISSGLLATLISTVSIGYWHRVTASALRQARQLMPAMIKFSFGPLVAAMAYAAAVSLDRQLVQLIAGLSETAVYSFYASCGAAVAAVLQFGFTLPANARLMAQAKQSTMAQTVQGGVTPLRRQLVLISIALLILLPSGFGLALHMQLLSRLPLGPHAMAMTFGLTALALARIWFEFETSVDYANRRNKRVRILNLSLALLISAFVPLGGWIGGAMGAMGAMVLGFCLTLVARAFPTKTDSPSPIATSSVQRIPA